MWSASVKSSSCSHPFFPRSLACSAYMILGQPMRQVSRFVPCRNWCIFVDYSPWAAWKLLREIWSLELISVPSVRHGLGLRAPGCHESAWPGARAHVGSREWLVRPNHVGFPGVKFQNTEIFRRQSKSLGPTYIGFMIFTISTLFYSFFWF
jgi:hypothetical protein